MNKRMTEGWARPGMGLAGLLALAFLLTAGSPCAHAAPGGYAAYDLQASALMEQQNDLFESALAVMQNLSVDAASSNDAALVVQDLRAQMAQVSAKLHAVKCERRFGELHERYLAFSDALLETADRLAQRAAAYRPASADDLRVFLAANVKDAFEVSKKNIGILYAVLDVLKSEDFSKESEAVRQFYRWQSATLPLDIYIIGNFIESHLYINMMFADESTIRAGAENLRLQVSLVDRDAVDVKARIEGIRAPARLESLHDRWRNANLKALGFFIIAKGLFDTSSRELFSEDLQKLGSLSMRVAELMKDVDRRTLRFMRESF